VDVLGMKGKKVKNYDNDGFSTSSHAFLWGEREVTLGIAKLNSFFLLSLSRVDGCLLNLDFFLRLNPSFILD
jgi:hypothetical protein